MPATDAPFANMRRLPDQAVAEWHDPDEIPRYLQLMEANLAFNNARDELQRKRAAWAAEEGLLLSVEATEDESFRLVSEAERALFRVQMRTLGAMALAGAAVGAAAMVWWLLALVLQAALVLFVCWKAWQVFSGYRAERAAAELVRAASLKDREQRTKAREAEQRAAEDRVRELQVTAQSETANAERGVRILEKAADAPT